MNQYLENERIPRMDWPAYSPGLNLIKHLWDQLKRAVDKRIEEETTPDDSSALLQEEWNAIPEKRIIRLINSMRSRVQQVVDRNGGYTRYRFRRTNQ